MPRQRGICMRSNSKSMKTALIELSRGISIWPPSKNTQSSTPSVTGSKIKELPEENYDDELPAGI